jgi:hypothetical protein
MAIQFPIRFCVPCRRNVSSANFSEHLYSNDHLEIMMHWIRNERQDFHMVAIRRCMQWTTEFDEPPTGDLLEELEDSYNLAFVPRPPAGVPPMLVD